jgi:hypothetical protein
MKITTLFWAAALCLPAIGCSKTPTTETKEDPAAFFTEYQGTVNAIAQKVLANDYAGAKSFLASQKASLQDKCQAVRASGGDYPYQITIKTVAAKATLADAIARSTGAIDLESASNDQKLNEQRELVTEFNSICKS